MLSLLLAGQARLLNKEPYLGFDSWADIFSTSIFCSLFLSIFFFFDFAISAAAAPPHPPQGMTNLLIF